MRLTRTALGSWWNLDVTHRKRRTITGAGDDLARDAAGESELPSRIETDDSRHPDTPRLWRLADLLELGDLGNAALHLAELAIDIRSFLGDGIGDVGDHLAPFLDRRVLG